MEKQVSIHLKRFNIYSSLTLNINDQEICFDPAKIRKEDLKNMNPDMIFISHESMDHMDPSQVYYIQKKKNCPIFCSIAVAVDLIQYFSLDLDFIDNIIVMVPGSMCLYNNIRISSVQSIHCDYMVPIVFRIDFQRFGVSILHCFDSHISPDIIRLSQGTTLAIIPIGIAKGISAKTGFDFVSQLHSTYFVTNHFKDEKDLAAFYQLIQNTSVIEQCFLVNWNQTCNISLPIKDHTQHHIKSAHQDSNKEFISTHSKFSKNFLTNFFVLLWQQGCQFIEDDTMIPSLLHSYRSVDAEEKQLILAIATLLCLLYSHLVSDVFIANVQEDLSRSSAEVGVNLKSMILFFLGICAQKKHKLFHLPHILSMVDKEDDHINYWIVEYLGRSATLEDDQSIKIFMTIIKTPMLYHSVVVRRKIFWEIYRIVKYCPQISAQFIQVLEEGLADDNPDVRLLAILCMRLVNRTDRLTSVQIKQIVLLFDDPEDDVKETAVRVIGYLYKNHSEEIIKNLDRIKELTEDENCHVRIAAEESYKYLTSISKTILT